MHFNLEDVSLLMCNYRKRKLHNYQHQELYEKVQMLRIHVTEGGVDRMSNIIIDLENL